MFEYSVCFLKSLTLKALFLFLVYCDCCQQQHKSYFCIIFFVIDWLTTRNCGVTRKASARYWVGDRFESRLNNASYLMMAPSTGMSGARQK